MSRYPLATLSLVDDGLLSNSLPIFFLSLRSLWSIHRTKERGGRKTNRLQFFLYFLSLFLPCRVFNYRLFFQKILHSDYESLLVFRTSFPSPYLPNFLLILNLNNSKKNTGSFVR